MAGYMCPHCFCDDFQVQHFPDCVKYQKPSQPAPIRNDQPAIWGLLIEDMKARDHFGATKYGTRLQPFNGRDALKDAYEEALDLLVYLRQAIYERDNK